MQAKGYADEGDIKSLANFEKKLVYYQNKNFIPDCVNKKLKSWDTSNLK